MSTSVIQGRRLLRLAAWTIDQTLVCTFRCLRWYVVANSSPCRGTNGLDSSTEPANLTRELHLRQGKRFWVRPTTLAPHLEHLARFTNITTLVLVGLATSTFRGASLSDCFGPFVPRIQHLRLNRPVTRPNSLVQLVLFFSAANDIEVQDPQWGAFEEDGFYPHPPPRRTRLAGTLFLRGFGERWPHFFTLLSAEQLEFRKTRLIGCEFDTSVPTQSFLDAISQNTRILHLVAFGRRESRVELFDVQWNGRINLKA